MKIETKFDISQQVWWRTTSHQGRGQVLKVYIETDSESTLETYKVKLHDHDIAMTFPARDIFVSEEELNNAKK